MRSGEKRPDEPDEAQDEEEDEEGVEELKGDEEELCRYVSGETLEVDLVSGGRGGRTMGEEKSEGDVTVEW